MTADRDVVIVCGVRTPFARAWTTLAPLHAAELGRIAVREAVERSEIEPDAVDEVVVGNFLNPIDATNIARVIALHARLPRHVPAITVNRAGASGLDAVVEAAYRIRSGDADLVVAAAVESMSRFPLQFDDDARDILTRGARARGWLSRLARLSALRPRHFKPPPGLREGMTDPISNLRLGQTADIVAREFGVSRADQDAFALRSHRRAAAAWEDGHMGGEVVPVPLPPDFASAMERDNGIRSNPEPESLAALAPVFDRDHGTVTAGNSSQLTDGAVALVLASRRRATELGLTPLGAIRSWGFAGCDPVRMGLGPVLATPVALHRAGGMQLVHMERVEIHEAFAAQVLACSVAFGSRRFCEAALGTGPVGELEIDRVNARGGAIAIGHPVAASGARMILTLAREMERADLELGLATMCVGGGQGAAVVLERS